MRKILIFSLLAVVVLSACSASPSDQQVLEEEQPLTVAVYRSPT
jgi:uncharacterized lipoprotein